MALAAGEVIGVFPEGTSYTQPSVMQVMSGTAWTAIDYVKWAHQQDVNSPPLTIVPVGIVYTDKARYQSLCQVCILLTGKEGQISRLKPRYGKPIIVDTYTQDIFKEGVDAEAAARTAVKQITAEIEKQMRAMTVNAPDWDTLYAAQMARDIIYEDPVNIPLKNWLSVSQSLVDTFTAQLPPAPGLDAAKSALTTYYALLHYTGISHSSLTVLLPTIHVPLPTRILHIAVRMPIAFLNLLLFLPPMLLHISAYLMGHIAPRVLVEKGEVEGQAQFKAIFGGVGLGIGVAAVLRVLRKSVGLGPLWNFATGGPAQEGLVGGLRRTIGALGVAYSSVYLLVRWHNALVYGNYKRLKTLLTLCKLCLGLLPQRPASPGDLEKYRHPPEPPPNHFIKGNQETDGVNGGVMNLTRDLPTLRSIPTRKLIRPLLAARKDALSALEAYLKTRADDSHHDTQATIFLSGPGVRTVIPAGF
ncbi:hypothetical protein C0991_009862 [Blastosporella zonata]|nr:hypothetical protein C0991_009862 [Blastosporella zonata]